MIRKWILILLVFIISFNLIYSDLSNIELSKPLKVKLYNTKKFKTHLLCITAKGFVIWKSSYYYTDEDISKYAEYHSFEDLEYLQVAGTLNLAPLLVSIVLGASFFIGAEIGDEIAGATIKSAIVGLLGIFSTFSTMFIPRRFFPQEEGISDIFPKKNCTFSDEIPNKLVEFIKLYE